MLFLREFLLPMLLLVNAVTSFIVARHGARVVVQVPRVNHQIKNSVEKSLLAAQKLRQEEKKRHYTKWLFDQNETCACAPPNYYYSNLDTSFAELYGSYKNNFEQDDFRKRDSVVPNWTESLLIFGVACVMVYFMHPI
jgi:hypothetical protein